MFEKISTDIKRIYLNTRNSDDFLDKFHQKLRVYVKENEPRKSVDYQKLTHHLNNVATKAKRKDWKSSVYLKKVSKIIIYTTKGKQDEIELDPSQETIFDFSPLDLDEDPSRKHLPDFTPRRKDDYPK